MRKHVLACALAASLALAPSPARAGVIDDLVSGFVVILVASTLVVGTVGTLTVAATYKNYRSSSRHEDASAGWVGVGGVGGLAFAGLGSMLLVQGLPESSPARCSDAKSSLEPERYEPTANPEICTIRQPARSGEIVFGTLLMGLGALSVGYAIKAATTDARPAGPSTLSPGTAPAFIGLSTPVFRF